MLHLNVQSPRIVFYQSLRMMRGFMKLVILVGLVGAGLWYGGMKIVRHYNSSPEYILQHLNVHTDGFFTQQRVAEVGGIDINGSIFKIDIDEVEAKLLACPEVVSADVQRRLPDTVEVTIKERVPVAWLACPSLGMAGRNPISGILMDAHGVVFRCEGALWDAARDLPVIELISAEEESFVLGEKMSDKDTARALSLLELIQKRVGDAWYVQRIVVSKFYAMDVYTSEGVRARFGMYEHERQLSDYQAARAHALQQKKELEWIDLLPRHNIPGGYKETEPVSDRGDDQGSF